MAKGKKLNQKMREWIDARKRHHLSHVQVQMARELVMIPMKFGKLDNHGRTRKARDETSGRAPARCFEPQWKPDRTDSELRPHRAGRHAVPQLFSFQGGEDVKYLHFFSGVENQIQRKHGREFDALFRTRP